MKKYPLQSILITALITTLSGWAVASDRVQSATQTPVLGQDQLAVNFYYPLAESGEPYAQLTLGEMFANGEGVSKNPVVAYAWLALAQHNGIEEARPLTQNLVKIMSEQERSQAEALGQVYIGIYADR